jgi:hypothetical protein
MQKQKRKGLTNGQQRGRNSKKSKGRGTKSAETQQMEAPNATTEPALLAGQAWSNCCGAAVAEEELDKENNCKDQSEGSECVKQQKRRGKRKRAPRTMQ